MAEEIPPACRGEKCFCGANAFHKVAEEPFDADRKDPFALRHPYSAYVCKDCFARIMRLGHQSLADQIFDVKRLYTNLEETLIEFATSCFDEAWDDIRTDYYDVSVEFDGVGNDHTLSEEKQKQLWAWGFERVWLNHNDGMETYYYRRGDIAGSRKRSI